MATTKTQAEVPAKAPPPTVDVQPEVPEKQEGPAHATPIQRAVAPGALPPSHEAPSAARAAELLTTPEENPGAPGRARLITGLQQSAGNTRVNRMLGTTSTSAQANDQLQRKVDSSQPIIQRMVLNLDLTDETIIRAANIEIARQNRASPHHATKLVTEENWYSQDRPLPPLWYLRPDEPLTILAHGEPAFGDHPPKVAGKSPEELYDYLVTLGLTPALKGEINLSNCTTAWSRREQGSFASRFLAILQQHGHQNKVTGFQSFVSSEDMDTETEVEHDQRELSLALFMADRYINLLNDYDNTRDFAQKQSIREKFRLGATSLKQEVRKLIDAHQEEFVLFYTELSNLLLDFYVTKDNGKPDFGVTFSVNILELKRKYNLLRPHVRRITAHRQIFKPTAEMLAETHVRRTQPYYVPPH